MGTADSSSVPVSFIDGPRDPALVSLYSYWNSKRGDRLMPTRADIKPSEIKPLLPSVIMWSGSAPFVMRLVGDNVARFVGRNNTGMPAAHDMPPEAAQAMNEVLTQVADSKAPRFRAGKTFWKPDKVFRDFESCFLPLSADGEHVDMILGGLKVDV